MVTFQELRISPDGKTLVLNIESKNCNISEIYIDTQCTFISDTSPSDKSIKINMNTNKATNKYVENINLSEYNIDNNNLLYIYVATDADSNSPAKPWYLGITTYMYHIYTRLMQGIKEVDYSCSTPHKFIDDYIKFKALDLYLRTGNYIQANHIFLRYFKNKNNSTYVSPKCNC